jgi:hypothetical protein
VRESWKSSTVHSLTSGARERRAAHGISDRAGLRDRPVLLTLDRLNRLLMHSVMSKSRRRSKTPTSVSRLARWFDETPCLPVSGRSWS